MFKDGWEMDSDTPFSVADGYMWFHLVKWTVAR